MEAKCASSRGLAALSPGMFRCIQRDIRQRTDEKTLIAKLLGLNGAELAVPRVAETRNDVSRIIESLVDRRRDDADRHA
jgi:hypothetical protein